MEPSTLIVTALTAAITEIGKDTFTDAAKAAYGKLKELLQKRFQGKQEAQAVLVVAEHSPKESQALLKKTIVESGADQIPEIVDCARTLLSMISPQQASVGKYNTNISGNVQGFAQGDNATVNISLDKDKL